ncbi:hypothetical protein M0802_006141 [Mischocyttarus mexicanus]|nr:hypothetical protein M0802_006141 [Mischocyttarus mexicanus]
MRDSGAGGRGRGGSEKEVGWEIRDKERERGLFLYHEVFSPWRCFCQRALHDRFEVKLRSSNALPVPAPAPAPASAPAPAPAPAPVTEVEALRPRNALASSDQDYSMKLTGREFDNNPFF